MRSIAVGYNSDYLASFEIETIYLIFSNEFNYLQFLQ